MSRCKGMLIPFNGKEISQPLIVSGLSFPALRNLNIQYGTIGIVVMTKIVSKVFRPVILTPKSKLRVHTTRVTRAMDSPKDNTTLSITVSCPKKTSVQAKPGRKKTSRNPRNALRNGTCSSKGREKSSACFIMFNKSMCFSTTVPVYYYVPSDYQSQSFKIYI